MWFYSLFSVFSAHPTQSFSYVTTSMEQNPRKSSQEIPHSLWNLEDSLPRSNSPLVINLGHINPVHVLPSHFLAIYFKIITPSTPTSFKWPLFFMFPHQNPVGISLLPHTSHMPNPSHSSSFSYPHNIRGDIQTHRHTEHKALRCALLSKFPVTSSLFGTNISLSTLLSNTFSLCSYFCVRDWASHSYKTTGKLQFYVFQSLYFWQAKGKIKYSVLNSSRHSPNLICSLTYFFIKFWFNVFVPRILNLPHFQRNQWLSVRRHYVPRSVEQKQKYSLLIFTNIYFRSHPPD